jgi:hypothetical protein
MWANSYGYSCYLMGAMLPGRYIQSAQNFACAGNDVGTTTQQVASAANCATQCAAISGAVGFMFKTNGVCACKSKVVPTAAEAGSSCFIFNTPATTGMQFAVANYVDMVPYTLPLGKLAWDGAASAFRLQGNVAPKAIGGDGVSAMVGTVSVTCAPSPSLKVSQTTLMTKNFGLVACKNCGNFTFAYAGSKACIAPPPAPLAPTISSGSMSVSPFTSRAAGALSMSTTSSGFPSGLTGGCTGPQTQSSAAASFTPVQLTAKAASSPQACAAVVSAPAGSYLGLDVCPVQANGFSLRYTFSISAPSAAFNSIGAGLSLSFVDASTVPTGGAVAWQTDVFGMPVPVSVSAPATSAVTLEVGCGRYLQMVLAPASLA